MSQPPPPPPSGPPSGQPWQGGPPHQPYSPVPPIAPPPYPTHPAGAPPSFNPYGAPPPRRRTGLVIGLVALIVVLVATIGVGTFFLVTREDDDGGTTVADPATSSPASPTDPGTEAPSPTAPESPSAPDTPYAPTDDAGDDVHGDVATADFPGDWDFKFGDVEHHATLDWAEDFSTCAPVEKGSVLTQQRCEYAAQWTYTALGGKAKVTHIFLVFDTEPHAKAAQTALTDADLDLRADSFQPGWESGKWNSSSYGNIVGVTVGTADPGVKAKALTSVVNHMNTDYRSALLFKL